MTTITAADTTSPSARLAAALEAHLKTGQVTRDTPRTDQTRIPRIVGFGIHVHQGNLSASVLLLAGLEKLFARRRPISPTRRYIDMTNRRQMLTLLSALPLAFASPVLAHDYRLGALQIDHPWTRATAATAKAGGGFLTIVNKGNTPDRLIAARSPASMKVEVHEMKMDGSIMRMREVEGGLEIPAGATVMLKPGGFHIMFMELKEPLAKGGKVPVTLVFEKAGSIDVDFKIEAAGAAASHH